MEQMKMGTVENTGSRLESDINRRCYGEFKRAKKEQLEKGKRETEKKLRDMGIEPAPVPEVGLGYTFEYHMDVDKVLAYAKDDAAREKDMFNIEAQEAMEAVTFLEWLENGKKF